MVFLYKCRITTIAKEEQCALCGAVIVVDIVTSTKTVSDVLNSE